MGYFSWCCGICDQEIMHGKPRGYAKFSNAIVLWANGDRISGEYDGYGRIGGIENLAEQRGDWRMVHQSCYDGQSFDALKPERHAENQGCGYSERLLLERYGKPDPSEFKFARDYFCYECKRTWKANWSGGVCPFGCVRPKNYRDSEEVIRRAADPKDYVNGDYHELVEPFAWMGGDYDRADGLIVCHNEHVERTDYDARQAQREAGTLDKENPPTKIEPCFYHGGMEQARVTKPEEWDEMTAYFTEDKKPKPFVVRCSGCKSTNVEIFVLTPTDAPNRCEFCGHESEDGCHECEVHWCGGCRHEHDCPGERSDEADEK